MRQESHRIHWQQWVSQDPQSKRDLMTRSAAIRLTDAATTSDVVKLLKGDGALVLVGTLYNMAPIKFVHEATISPVVENQVGVAPPFHLIRTLQLQQNPLQVRDAMQLILDKKYEALKQLSTSSSSITPKLQWFFVPSEKQDSLSKTSSAKDKTITTPNWIELDGYCTSMEEQDFEKEDQDDEDQDEFDDQIQEQQTYIDPMVMPWRKNNDKDVQAHSQSSEKYARYYVKQMQRHQQLSMYRKDHPRMISGYLYKQSNRDAHVWRKVHCVLTKDYLWFVTRIRGSSNMAHHDRISLNRASIIDRHGHKGGSSWEVVSALGRTHHFRAKTAEIKQAWVMCLKERIQQCHENQLLEQAELIVSEETSARNKRMLQYYSIANSSRRMIHNEWALRVVAYRELCRHIQHRLPSKPLVLVMKNPPAAKSSSADSSLTLETMDIDECVQAMISDSWDLAAGLLNEVTDSISAAGSSDTTDAAVITPNNAAHRNLETLCRHIDYILTGKLQPLSEEWSDTIVPPSIDKLHDPPPVDLFDKLFVELGK